ncbi:MAG: protein kinase [Proteobacteria bacterium]|nr:protein kinase [Pseudomonadota bacterium]
MTTLGPFELDRLLGRGGMGEVWAATHTHTGLKLAVKRVISDDAAAFAGEFANEVRAVAGLDHPGIVRVFDRGVDDSGRPWLAMERAEAPLDIRPPRRWSVLRHTLMQMLSALAHAHARGVIHRDLKPSNALVCEDGRVVLADFGLAWALDQGAARTAGSPGFMAPEQVTGRWRDYGAWTDLYALGATAWELSCGRPLYQRESLRELLRAQLHDEPEPYRPAMAVPEGFEAWLHRCLAKLPSHRFPNAAAAALELGKLGPAHGVGAPAPKARALPTLTFSLGSLPVPTQNSDEVDTPATALTPPQDWRQDEDRGSRWVQGLGLGLFALRPAPLSGRAAIQDQLWATLHEVCAGASRSVVLCGAAGVGKSRLAEWLVQRGLEVGAVDQLRIRDDLREALLDRLHARGLNASATAARARRLGIAVSDAVGAWLAGDDTPSPSTQLQLTLAVADALSARRPLVVWLDDPQALGQRLARHLATLPGPVLSLVSIRGTVPESLSQAEGIEVPALDESGAKALAKDLLLLDEALVERLVERADGNPLFAVRIVADWVGKGWLRPGPSGFELTPAARSEVPDDLHQLWLREVERSVGAIPDHAHLMHLLALLPVPAQLPQWRRIATARGLEANATLIENLLDAGLGTVDADSFRFAHGLFRESMVRAAREQRDPNLWRELAADLAQAPATSVLAGQTFLESGSAQQALEPLIQGVTYAARVRDHPTVDVATACFDQAAASLGLPPDSPFRQQMAEETALVPTTRRDPGASAKLAALEEQAEALGWTNLTARVWHARAAEALITGQLHDAIRLATKAQELAAASETPRTIRAVAGVLGSAYIAVARLNDAERAYRFALSYGEGLKEAHVALAEIALGRGDAEGARAHLDKVSLGADIILRVNHAMISGELAWETGDTHLAIDQFRVAERIMLALRHDEIALPRMCLGLSLVMDDRLEEAAEQLRGLKSSLTGDYGIIQRLAFAAAGDQQALAAVREAVAADPDAATSAIGHAAETALRTARRLDWPEQAWLESYASKTWHRLGRARPYDVSGP